MLVRIAFVMGKQRMKNTLDKLKILAFVLILSGAGLCIWGSSFLGKDYFLLVTDDAQSCNLSVVQSNSNDSTLLREKGQVETACLLDERELIYSVKSDGIKTVKVFDIKEGALKSGSPSQKQIDYLVNKEKRTFTIRQGNPVSGLLSENSTPRGFQAVALIPDSMYVLGFLRGKLHIFDKDTRAVFNTDIEEADSTISLSSGNKRMAVVGQGVSDSSLSLFNLEDMYPIHTEKISGKITNLDWNEAGTALVLVAREGKTSRCYKYSVANQAWGSPILDSHGEARVFYLAEL